MSQESLDHIVAGALFDFGGFLTTRDKEIVCSASNDAAPMVEAIKEFAVKRGLEIDGAMVVDWHARCAGVASPQAARITAFKKTD